jgi:succinyl-CoA synthetase beta subunit
MFVFLLFFSFKKSSNSFFVVALERRFGGPVIITSTQGGSHIEEIAAEHPDAIIHHPIDIMTGLERKDALKIGEQLGFRNEALEEVRQFNFFKIKFYIRFLRQLIQ